MLPLSDSGHVGITIYLTCFLLVEAAGEEALLKTTTCDETIQGLLLSDRLRIAGFPRTICTSHHPLQGATSCHAQDASTYNASCDNHSPSLLSFSSFDF